MTEAELNTFDTMGNQEVLQWARGIYGTTQPFGGQQQRVGYLSLYAIVSNSEALLIDAGFGENDSVYRLLDEVKVPIENASLFLTHLHIDHIGMASALAREGVPLKMRRSRNASDQLDPAALLRLVGSPADPGHQRTLYQLEANRVERSIGHPIAKLEAGSELRVGTRSFRVLEFAGHAKGHGGLFEEETGIIFTGDQIIDQIVPAVSAWYLDRHDMARFYESLEEVKRLHPKIMFPAHLRPVYGEENIIGVIDHIKRSFDVIVRRVGNMLGGRGEWMTSAELARLFYGYRVGGFDGFSPMDQTFRLTKMLAYLEALYDAGKAERMVDENGAARYRII